jgi:NTE family protein
MHVSTDAASNASPKWPFPFPFAFPFPFPFPFPFLVPAAQHNWQKVYNDTIDFWAALLAPTDLNFYSEGLCQPFPFIKDVIDFDKLAAYKGQIFMNALNITTGKMETFGADALEPEHFDAALAFPFVYAPVKIGDSYYLEGSSQDPLGIPNFKDIVNKGDIKRNELLVLIDVLGSFGEKLVRRPENLLDAFGISIICPIVSLAKMSLDLYKSQPDNLPLEIINYEIPEAHVKRVSDWSDKNMKELWDVGYKRGEDFVKQFADRLPDRADDGPNPVWKTNGA